MSNYRLLRVLITGLLFSLVLQTGNAQNSAVHVSQLHHNILLSGDDLAARCGLSSAHFARAFRQSFGVTVHKYLMNLRLEQAKQHLAKGKLSLEEIARKAGYADQATFTESFKRFAGTPPGRFRRRFLSAMPRLEHANNSFAPAAR